MIAIAMAFVVAASNAPEEEQRQFRAAIWADLQLNAMIGNGNWPASLWYNAGSGEQPNLHIQELTCRPRQAGYRCAFVLFREGGKVEVFGQQAPDLLRCRADLLPDPQAGGGWQVKHFPPLPAGGHTRTSLSCRSRR